MNILNPIQRRKLLYDAPLPDVKNRLHRLINDKTNGFRLVEDRGNQMTLIWRGPFTGGMPPTVHISMKEEQGRTEADCTFMLPEHVIGFSKIYLGLCLFFFALFLAFVPGWHVLYPVGMIAFMFALIHESLWFSANTVCWIFQNRTMDTENDTI